MADLAGHRTEVADLPEQPLEDCLAALRIARHELPGFLGKVDEDRARFEHRYRRALDSLIDDGRHAVVRADGEELGLELIARAYIHWDHPVL